MNTQFDQHMKYHNLQYHHYHYYTMSMLLMDHLLVCILGIPGIAERFPRVREGLGRVREGLGTLNLNHYHNVHDFIHCPVSSVIQCKVSISKSKNMLHYTLHQQDIFSAYFVVITSVCCHSILRYVPMLLMSCAWQ